MDLNLRTLTAAGMAAFFLAAAPLSPVGAQERAAAAANAPASFHAMASNKLPAVVSVLTTQRQADSGSAPSAKLPEGLEDFMERFFGENFADQWRRQQPRRAQRALGSGFIISADGYVVTNNHVVENAASVRVLLHSGKELNAKIVGRDPKTDLALLKVESGQSLPTLAWGDSDKALIGDWVVAIGNPFGLGGTITAGIVSARARNIQAGPYDDFIQTDAAINTGNSGGPLLDMSGNVVGVNTAIFSPVGANVGIGFAIPSSLAQPIIQQLRETGEVRRGWLGVQIQSVTPEIAEAVGLDEARGALVAGVMENSPAAKAGVEQGDIILSFQGKQLSHLRDLTIAVADAPINQQAEMVIWREGKRMTLTPQIARLEASESEQAAAPPARQDRPSALGLTLAPLTPELRRQHDIEQGTNGVLVVEVAPGSAAENEGFRVGDLITQVGREKVGSPQEVTSAVSKARDAGRKTVLILRQRNDAQSFVAVPIGSRQG